MGDYYAPPRKSRQYFGKQMPTKPFYVFFKTDCDMEGKYAVIEATSIDRATEQAISHFGNSRVSCVEREEYGKAKASLFKFEKVENNQ